MPLKPFELDSSCLRIADHHAHNVIDNDESAERLRSRFYRLRTS